MPLQWPATLSLLCFGLLAHSFPVVEPAQSSKSIRIGIRSKPLQSRAAQALDHSIATPQFNFTLVEWEFKSVVLKYLYANQFLQGFDLAPDTHAEQGYPPFNPPSPPSGTLIAVEAENMTAPSLTPASDDSVHVMVRSASGPPGIIGMPPVGPKAGQAQLQDFLSGFMDILYYGLLDFGSPKQPMTVDIDTGSADLWVPTNCKGCANTQFNPAKSSTYKGSTAKCSMTYGTGSVSGQRVQDVVSMGSLTVNKQTFCAVRKESDDLNNEPNSGLLGMAFGTIAQMRKPTFFENLLQTKQLAQSIFSVHLTRGQETGSELCLGCYDPTKAVGPIAWNPVVSRTYWTISMSGLATNATQSLETNLIAAIDTGTSLIYVPDDVARNFYALIPGSSPAVQYGTGYYTYPCDTTLEIALNFGGQSYAIHPDDFNLGRTDADSGNCVGGILALGSGFPPDLAIIGDEFLKSWYSVYDYAGRVGFAPSVNNK